MPPYPGLGLLTLRTVIQSSLEGLRFYGCPELPMLSRDSMAPPKDFDSVGLLKSSPNDFTAQ